MANQDYSPQSERISFQADYFRTVPGILKIIEFIIDLIALIIGAAATNLNGDVTGHKGFFTFVAVFALIITTILLILAVLNVQNVCMQDRWYFIEMVWCLFIVLLYFIASIVVATVASRAGVYGAAAFFGFAAFLTYLAEAFYHFRILRNPPSRQATEVYRQTTTTTTTAARQQPTY